MSLVSAVQAELPYFRAQAESLMVDRWVVEEVTPGTVLNEDTGEYEDTVVRVYPTPGSPDPDGPGKFTAANTAVNDVDAAGQLLVVQSATLALPVVGSELVREGHVAQCVSSQNDPGMVGVRVRVEGPHHQTFATARRFRVKEVT